MLKRITSYYWWCQILGWGFWAILNIVVISTIRKDLSHGFFLSWFFWVITCIGVTHLLRTLILRLNWLNYKLDRLIIRILVAVSASGLLITAIMGLFNMLLKFEKDHTFFHVSRFLGASFLVLLWIMIYFLYHYFQKEQQYNMDKLRLEAVVKDLELRNIKNQLNPHFIFNALNSIRALVDENPQRARTAITELSNILRSSMQAEKMETVSLENELSIVKDYLALEHIRFEERLLVSYDIDPETLELPVPPMMLQTLVENAIKHGISKSVHGGNIEIHSHLRNDGTTHELLILNTGTLPEEQNEKGFGLHSTRQRLELLYKDQATFAISNLNGKIVEARVELPVSMN